jgi:hypothetical protein
MPELALIKQHPLILFTAHLSNGHVSFRRPETAHDLCAAQSSWLRQKIAPSNRWIKQVALTASLQRTVISLHSFLPSLGNPHPLHMTAALRLILAPNIGPSLFRQNRTVTWLMSMPRFCSRSSTFRSDSGYRRYIMTARRMISGLVLKYRKGLRFVIP